MKSQPETFRDIKPGQSFLWTEETRRRLHLDANNPKVWIDWIMPGLAQVKYERTGSLAEFSIDEDDTWLHPVDKTFFADIGL